MFCCLVEVWKWVKIPLSWTSFCTKWWKKRKRNCSPGVEKPEWIPQSPLAPPILFLERERRWVLLLLSHFSRVQLCVTPSLGFSRQEHWSGLPFPSPMHKSEKWKWNRSVMSDSSRPHGLQPTRLLRPWDFPGKSTGVGCHCLLQNNLILCLSHAPVSSVVSDSLRPYEL